MFDWLFNRVVVGFLDTYTRSRAAGIEHTKALELVLRSYRSLSVDEQASAWVRFLESRKRRDAEDLFGDIHDLLESDFGVSKIAQANERDFFSLIFHMMWEFDGPWDDAKASKITDRISKTIRDHPSKWD